LNLSVVINNINSDKINSYKMEKKLENLKLNKPREDNYLDFLPNPKFTENDLKGITNRKVSLYANLYKLSLKKTYTLFEYAIKFQNEETMLSTVFKRKIMAKVNNELNQKYGTYFFTGDVLYGTVKIKEVINVLAIYKRLQYSILIQPTEEVVELKNIEEQIKTRPAIKTILEIMVKDIIRANPAVKFVKNLYGKKYDEHSASSKNHSVSIFPGFTTKIMVLESGIYLNVDVKNKILSSTHCLEIIKNMMKNPKPTKKDMDVINNYFKERVVETVHTNQRFQIESVNFEKKPNNTTQIFEGKEVKLVDLYKKLFGVDITGDQPLLLVKLKSKKASDTTTNRRYLPPQLCLLVGLTDKMVSDYQLMKSIADVTKQNPDDKVNSINDVLKLINETKGIVKIIKESNEKVTLKSSYQKKEEYGLELEKSTKSFNGYNMVNPVIKGANGETIRDISKPFKIAKAKKINFICFYHKLYEKDKQSLESLIEKAGYSYGIMIGKADYKALTSENYMDWTKEIQAYYKPDVYNLVIIYLDDYLESLGFYANLKKFTLEAKGINTQFILTKSVYNKNAMSIVSNILLQVNAKIGGNSYTISFNSEITKKNLMIVGVDSSQVQGEHTVAMCATINNDFTEYTSKKDKYEDSFNFPIASFIAEALTEYFKLNKRLPEGIIIYRQGVSREQRYFLTSELNELDKLLTGKSEVWDILKDNAIPYYYILVNKKTSLKFFEKETQMNNVSFENPDPGLLICNGIVDNDVFEFFVQPQKVKQGSATPTNFMVAQGNLNCPSLLFKLTYDLCHLYCNWRGPVRVPAPLKYAEKLAKINPNVNEKLKNCKCFI
jgi:aubergine-like protein